MSGRKIIEALEEAIAYSEAAMSERNRLLHHAERLVRLLREPQPGLMTWQRAVERERAAIAHDKTSH